MFLAAANEGLLYHRLIDLYLPLQAWCRRCDDIADNQDKGGPLGDQGTPKDAEDRVQALRILTKRAFEEQPTADAAFDAFGLVAHECGLTLEEANDVIAGFALDATRWSPTTEQDMMRYCYHVAGAVGIMMARIMGVPRDDGETLDRACDLGLAFQIADDLLDYDGDAELLGKPAGQDADRGKGSFVVLMGLEPARAAAAELIAGAEAALEPWGDAAAPLRSIARFAIERQS